MILYHALYPFTKLIQEDKIDEEQYNYVKGEIEYTYVYSLMSSLRSRNKAPEIVKRLKNEKFNKEMERMGVVHIKVEHEKWDTLISGLLEKYPYDNPYARFMLNYRSCLDTYLWFSTLKDSSLSNAFTQGKRQQIEIAKKSFNKSIYEYYYASKFGYMELNGSIDSMIALRNDFKQEFPNSVYLKGIENYIKNFTTFFGGYYPKETSTPVVEERDVVSLSKALIPGVSFIEGADSITSLESLLSKFKNKPVYVDIWASWCPPCRYEFQFADTLYDFLTRNGYEMLYLSVDKSEEKWLSVISQYALKGNHFRVSHEKFKAEISEIAPFIPTYMIIDKNGKIVISDARKPHETEALFQQLLNQN